MNQLSSINSYVITSKTGMELTVLNYGATISSLKIPLANEEKIDVVLGFDSPTDYVKSFELGDAPYFGAIVGRFAGRIRNGSFQLHGKQIQLNQNKGRHHIHGGHVGMSQKLWIVKSKTEGDEPSITLMLESADQDENYPGKLTVEVTYTLTVHNELKIEYIATTTADTLLNLTQHSYFNLDGHEGEMTDQYLKINAGQILETDEDTVPTGKIIELKNHPFDFSEFKAVPREIDDAFLLKDTTKTAAKLYSKRNQLEMEVKTNQPSMQVYVGGKVNDELRCKDGKIYHKTSGICFETQAYPDAPNHSHFPSAILKQGETYYQNTSFKFNYPKHNL